MYYKHFYILNLLFYILHFKKLSTAILNMTNNSLQIKTSNSTQKITSIRKFAA